MTKGVFDVQKICNIDISKEELIELVAYAENFSNHPIAMSIKKEYGKEIDQTKILDTKEVSGHGIIAKIEDKDVLVGNEKLMNDNNIEFTKCDEIRNYYICSG